MENSTSKSVLLLEDDEELRNTIQESLESRSYDVVAVRGGVEGLQKITARSFDVILCDMMMQALPCDMFYLAVKRVRPSLCRRFIFMTGCENDGKATDFIKSTNGLTLNKPFEVDDLLEMIAFMQVRANMDHDPALQTN